MAVTPLVVTPGAANANAYVTVAVADQYHLDRPAAGTTWDDADPDQKIAAILWATKLLDSLWEWEGFVTSYAQPLQWPRTGLLQRNGQTFLPDNAIPIELQYATAEYARQLLVSDLTEDSGIAAQKIQSLSVGPISLSFGAGVTGQPVPDAVAYLIPSAWGYPRTQQSDVRKLVRA